MNIKSLILLLSLILTTGACGGTASNDTIKPTGPDLDVAELSSIKIDQIKLLGGDNIYDTGILRPAVYLKCRDNDKYIACAGLKQGLDIVTKSGVIYGGIDVPLVPVDNASGTCLDVEVVFVEKDSNDCPETVNQDDNIIATSGPLKLDEDGEGTLLNNKIELGDGSNWILLTSQDGKPAGDVPPSASIAYPALTLDDFYFTRPAITDEEANFLLLVRAVDSKDDFHCSASFDSSIGVIKENIIYGGLNIQLKDDEENPCIIDDNNKGVKIDVHLTILTDDGLTKETLSTSSGSEQTVADLVDSDGIREKFQNDGGFVRFYQIDGF